MSVLLQKSNDNKYSALKLYDTEKKYASSVHCAYYSCVQYMIHALMKLGKKTLTQLESEYQTWANNRLNSGGSHVFYYQQIKELYRIQGKKDELPKLSEVQQLKKIREDADYKEVIIDEDKCKQAIEMSERILKSLEKTLQV